jgi:hypothetical protein
MNRFAFFLRTKLKENRFSESVMASLSIPSIDDALLCSGFFQEDPSYSVSTQRFAALAARKTPLRLTTVGYYRGGRASYTDFVAGIAKHCAGAPVTHKPLRIPGDKWHAKVFIGKAGGQAVVAAIGSSNLTRRAFDTLKNFNYECDVLFWDENQLSLNTQIANVLGQIPDESMSVVVGSVDQSHPVNRTPVSRKLEHLEREILANAQPLK